MSIVSYTTTVRAEKTAAEIQQFLAKNKAQFILCEYDTSGNPSGLSFRTACPQGILTFRLPVRTAAFQKVLSRMKVPPKMKTAEHANNVAWRVMKLWVQAQLSLVEAGLAEMAEVFLPYMQNEQGDTVYQLLQESKFRLLGHNPGSES